MFKQDEGPRKKRVQKPRSTPSVAEAFVYAEESWAKISEVITRAFLNLNDKKNLRQLTKAQFTDLEQLKLDVFTNFDIGDEVSEKTIFKSLNANVKTPASFTEDLENKNINIENMNIDTYRKYVIGSYVDHKLHN